MLTDLELEHGQKCLRIWQGLTSLPMVAHHVEFAKAIESEVQKQDTELIRQMLDALENHEGNYILTKTSAVQVEAVINAARKRLENT